MNLKKGIAEKLLKMRNKKKIGLIDVGSAEGLPSPWKENMIFVDKVLCFEPREKSKSCGKFVTINNALWKEPCEKNFYIYKGLNNTGSSLFRQNFDYVKRNYNWLCKRGDRWLAETWMERSELLETRKIKCDKLDNVLKRAGRKDFNFLKIDAQGAEYEILQGARNFLLNNCLGLHLELFTIPLYKGITLLGNVVTYLNGFGFELVKVTPAHGSFSSQNDCLFIKKGKKDVSLDAIKQVYGIN